MSAYSLLYVCDKDEIGEEVDKTTSDLPKIGKGELLTFGGGTVCEGYNTFGKVIYLSIFIFFILLRRYKCILQRKILKKRETHTLRGKRISVFLLIGSSTGSKLKRNILGTGVRFMP